MPRRIKLLILDILDILKVTRLCTLKKFYVINPLENGNKNAETCQGKV
jgi:hypothetical protein